MRTTCVVLLGAYALAGMGCFNIAAKGTGGAKSHHVDRRTPDPSDVAVPDGFEVAVVAQEFTFPVAVAFDGEGRPVVLEAGYSYGEIFTTPKLVRVEPDGSKKVVAEGRQGGPWTGMVYRDGAFYVADGGESNHGRILRIDEQTGETTELVKGIPTLGDHHTNGPAFGPDGKLYFATGTATNSGVVGVDNYQFGWLKRFPEFHDVPCEDIELTGWSAETENPLTEDPSDKVRTGAYQPFGKSDAKTIKGQVPCSGAVMRVDPAGGTPELVAWGFRNPFGVAFSPDGALYVTENGYDLRGSRPVFGTADNLWKVEQGRWYGWPDHSAGRKVYVGWDRPMGSPKPEQLLVDRGAVPEPVARFGVHSSSNGFDFSRSAAFGYEGHAFVAQFGDMTPATGEAYAPIGFKVVRVEPQHGVIHTFLTNRKGNGPATMLGTNGVERPNAARFSPKGDELYVVDFGVMAVSKQGPSPQAGTGVLWKVRKAGGG